MRKRGHQPRPIHRYNVCTCAAYSQGLWDFALGRSRARSVPPSLSLKQPKMASSAYIYDTS